MDRNGGVSLFRHKYKHLNGIAFALGLFFTVGLVLGTLALLYVPQSIVSEAVATFKINKSESFGALFKENLTFELVWMFVLWMLGSSAVTASFTGAVISLRGFVIGFSMAFSNISELGWLGIFTRSILPQCITALPLMSAFVIMCTMQISGRSTGYNGQAGYFIRGGLFFVLLVPLCTLETWLMLFFEKFC